MLIGQTVPVHLPGNTESDRSRDQALKAPIVEVRHSQQQANKPTDNPPNLKQSTRQNQEQTTDGVSPTSQLSVPTSSTESEVSSEPQEKKHGLWCRARSACGPLHPDRLLIMSRG